MPSRKDEQTQVGPPASPVLEAVPAQADAVAFLLRAVERPHHAYLLAGPEGCGKQLAVRAFAAALLCEAGGCGTCRTCKLTLDDRHPNVAVVEPEGRDIHVETIREEVWHPAYRTAPEPGRKIFILREADRLNPAAADALLKVLEEPPADAVLLLMSARPHELPDTVTSRCHVVVFRPLPEDFVIRTLTDETVEDRLAAVVARLAGGNVGRARRLASGSEGLAFRAAGLEALELASRGPSGALEAADLVLAASDTYRKGLKEALETDLAPFLDERGKPEEAFRGVIRRLEARHKRRLRRAERDYLDWILLSMSSVFRDRIASRVGADAEGLINLDLTPAAEGDIVRWTEAFAALEDARAALAEDLNLNPRLLLEHAFLLLGERTAA
jgi:DNA polymerase III subunit delta'